MTEPLRPTRRTRAHPSPGGLKELPQTTRKPRQTRKKQQVNEVTFVPMPESETSQQAAPQSISSRPSSRESQSESSQHIPESRSTSPPQQQLALPAPPIRNNNEDEQQQKRAPGNTSGPRKRSRPSEKADGQRPAKRSRTRNISRTITESQNQNDSSSDTGASPLLLLTAPSYHPDTSESEDEEEEPDQHLPSPRPSHYQRQFLTPKPNRPSPARQAEKKNSEPKKSKPTMMTDDMRERERIYFKKFGRPMPVYNPQLNVSRRRGVPTLQPAVVEDDSSEEDLGEDYMDGPSFTQLALTHWSRQPEALAKRRDEYDAAHPEPSKKFESTRKITPTRPSTTSPKSISKSTRILVPATRSGQEYILTRPDLIDTTRALVQWAERNKSSLPSPKQLETMLNNFAEQEQARAAEIRSRTEHLITPYVSPPPRHAAPDTELDVTSQGKLSEGVAAKAPVGNPSEVHQANLPQTPRPVQARPEESRSIWAGFSAVKNLISTPLHFFGRRSESSDSTNESPVGTFSFRHERNLPKATEFATPSQLASHKPAPQTERRSRAQTPLRRGAQTERRRRPEEPARKPLHLRGLLSKAEIAEIHREQDRQKLRETHANGVEDDELGDPSTPTHHAGEKRKRKHGDVNKPPCTPGGTFRVPSPDSSDVDSDEDEEGVDTPTSNRDIIWPSYVTKEQESLDGANPPQEPTETELRREQYARIWRIPMHQVPKDDLLLEWYFDPGGKWREFCKGTPKSYVELPFPLDGLLHRQYEAEEAAAEEERLPLWPGVAEALYLPMYLMETIDEVVPRGTSLPKGSQLTRAPRITREHKDMMQLRFNFKWDRLDFQPFDIPPPEDEEHPHINHFWENRVPPPKSPEIYEYNPRRKPSPNKKLVTWEPDRPQPTLQDLGNMRRKELAQWEAGWTREEPPQRLTLAEQLKERREQLRRAEREAVDSQSTDKEMPSQPNNDSSARPPPTSGEETRIARERSIAAEDTIFNAFKEKEKNKDQPDNIFNPSLSTYSDRKTVQIPSVFAPSSSFSVGTSGSAPSTSSGSATSSGPLEPKKWTQTPPPKPRPGNAQLPQQDQTASEDPLKPHTPQGQSSTTEVLKSTAPNFPQLAQSSAERATANALLHKPNKPSLLRNVMQMSPLNAEKAEQGQENVEQGGQKKQIGQAGQGSQTQQPGQHISTTPGVDYSLVTSISTEIQAYVNSIPESEIVTMNMPGCIYENWPQRSEAEIATDKFFR